MAQRKPKSSRSKPTLPPQLAAVNLHAAGIDIGAEAHWVAVPPSDDLQPVRCFGACTADLEALADWLATCGITTIALESTGVYWIPLFELLETRGFAVLLVDPQQVQKIKGRPKSDRHDCQWIQRLHTFGLLAGAFRPADQICVLRSYLRQRAMLLTSAAQHIQHMQKALTQMNLKLQHVVSDITGVTGLAILRAILAGERDPAKLAQLRDYRCKHDEATIARALLEPLHRISGVDLTQIEGIDETTSLVILSEIGLDMSRWPTVKHFTSWLGLCPHHRVSGGKVLSRRTKPCANRAATALRLAAACLHHSQSALGAFFRRMKARLGTPKAITATAHKLARLVYSMLKHGTAYVRQGMEEYEQQYRDRMVQNMTRRAKALGYTLVKATEGTPV